MDAHRHLIALVLAAALWLCAAFGAVAQVGGCLDETTVWTTPYPQGSIQAISYYVNIKVMTVLGRAAPQSVNMYVNVPQSVGQASFGLSNAESFVSGRVHGHYSQAILNEVTACPLLNETTEAYILGE